MKQISRRHFMEAAAAGALSASVLPALSEAGEKPNKKPLYIAAYDTEAAECLAAVAKIVDVHKRYEMPATFFIVGKTLLANPGEYRRLLTNPLFEVASHTYTHGLLRDHPFGPPAVSDEEKRNEIFKSKTVIENILRQRCTGLRTPYGYDNGLKGDPKVLGLVKEAGYDYVSSLLWGPDCSQPALLADPFNYAADGFGELWELPGHGWHENLLTTNNGWGPRRLTLWPPIMPEAIPDKRVSTPREEFEVYKVFIEKARRDGNLFVSFIWHPWSLNKFDPEMKMLDLMFDYVRGLGIETGTYGQLYRRVTA